MAYNRIYIVDVETGEYACIGKSFGEGFNLGNVGQLSKIIERTTDREISSLIIGYESDTAFYETYIRNGINVNKTGEWEVWEK